MIMIIIIVYLLINFSAQDIKIYDFYLEKCANVSDIVEKHDTLDMNIVHDFLLNKPSDNNIIEYIEWRNELLFKLLDCYPQEMVCILSSFSMEQRESIYNELLVPIHDGIDFKGILSKISSVDKCISIKNELKGVFYLLIQQS